MHVDLWVHSNAILRDSGTYSYNSDDQWIDYFAGVAGHNSIQFDDDEQMPRISRFLLGDWLRADVCEPTIEGGAVSAISAQYKNRNGCFHRRGIELAAGRLTIIDTVS